MNFLDRSPDKIDAEPQPPAIIAELSGNHDGSLARALETVEAIAESGAKAIKLQTYTPETITLDVDSNHFRIDQSHPLWGGKRLYDLYQRAHTPWEWHAELFEHARSKGLQVFSTPFDATAVDFLETLDNPVYKIASIEIAHIPLIEKAASTGKPLVLSTGTASLSEIDEAVRAATAAGAHKIVLLVCSSSYPAEPRDTNLARLSVLRQAFGLSVGLSDHTPGIGVAIAAVALGATLIEKHVTLDKVDGGVDSDFSITASELSNLVTETTRAFEAIGESNRWQTQSETTSLRLRPSIYITENVSRGDLISESNVRVARPSGGLAPKHYPAVLGRRFSRDVKFGEPLDWSHIDS